ncbi:hypothetical protein SAMD00023353_9600340 [Rosellinia necatrix]|uniref:Uncharacterized protein n=1 Tax=Rosellinia necatrix TaxID=77044 RepID=A0A1W2TVN0_ROSNE|nr:hypothetical protein SAMD00023353_9600340 [Rosellinia necatrix]
MDGTQPLPVWPTFVAPQQQQAPTYQTLSPWQLWPQVTAPAPAYPYQAPLAPQPLHPMLAWQPLQPPPQPLFQAAAPAAYPSPQALLALQTPPVPQAPQASQTAPQPSEGEQVWQHLVLEHRRKQRFAEQLQENLTQALLRDLNAEQKQRLFQQFFDKDRLVQAFYHEVGLPSTGVAGKP